MHRQCSSTFSMTPNMTLSKQCSLPMFQRQTSAVSCTSLHNTASTAPLLQAVKQRGDAIHELPFHVPGHKRGQGNHLRFAELSSSALRYDLTELNGLDYLASPTGVIKEAQQQAATVFGADHTWFLVNGCTVGIQAAILATCGPGEVLIAARNAHQSVLSGMVLSGCQPEWVYPELDEANEIAHCITPSALQAAIDRSVASKRTIGAVLLVSPTYYGSIPHLSALAAICHAHGLPLIVDEAHGAHLGLHPSFPSSALRCGADISIQSTHKVLSAMTQGAMLHMRGRRIDPARISHALQMLQTSSPSYLILASLDAVTLQLGDSLFFHEPVEAAYIIGEKLKGTPNVSLLHHQSLRLSSVAAYDPLRITMNTSRLGISGFEAAQMLERDYAVVPEMASTQVVVFALGPGTTINHANGLVNAVQHLIERLADTKCIPQGKDELTSGQVGMPKEISDDPLACDMTPREAFYCPKTRVQFAQGQGRTSVEMVSPYPPGVPVLIPGEKITSEALDTLRRTLSQGGKILGASDDQLRTLLVAK